MWRRLQGEKEEKEDAAVRSRKVNGERKVKRENEGRGRGQRGGRVEERGDSGPERWRRSNSSSRMKLAYERAKEKTAVVPHSDLTLEWFNSSQPGHRGQQHSISKIKTSGHKREEGVK